jgi:hypothetical protein
MAHMSRAVQRYPKHLRVPDAWRGNCLCGKWLVVLRVFTREAPLVCHGPCGGTGSCGRAWFINGDVAEFTRKEQTDG